jgi:hypothetical protein
MQFDARARESRAPRAARPDGFALTLALFFAIIVTGIVITGVTTLRANRTVTETSHAVSQATQQARAGLTEAAAWFRRQPSQPVLAFEPRLDMAATPQVIETDDPDIGIVREFRLTGLLWGRYEVWKEWEGDPDPIRLAWRRQFQTRDVSQARGMNPGSGWFLRSTGYVYHRRDPSKAYDEAPNQVIASQFLEVEIRRMSIAPPGPAAVNVQRGVNLTVNTKGRLFGGSNGSGAYYPQGTGTPNYGPPADNRVTGNPPLAPAASYDDSVPAVFGIEVGELYAMANDVVTNQANFPVPVPEYSILVAEIPAITFDSTQPLKSTCALVYIKGNVTILPGSFSDFSGLLYVDGNLTVRQPAQIKGSVIVTGNMTVQGSLDFADLYYDEETLNTLRLNIGNYRVTGAIRALDER